MYILQAGFTIFLILFCELRGVLMKSPFWLHWPELGCYACQNLQIDSLSEIRMNPMSTVLGLIRHAASWKCWPLSLGSLISIYSYDGTVRRVEAETVKGRAACRRGTQWLCDFLKSCSASKKCNLREWSDEESLRARYSIRWLSHMWVIYLLEINLFECDSDLFPGWQKSQGEKFTTEDGAGSLLSEWYPFLEAPLEFWKYSTRTTGF